MRPFIPAGLVQCTKIIMHNFFRNNLRVCFFEHCVSFHPAVFADTYDHGLEGVNKLFKIS